MAKQVMVLSSLLSLALMLTACGDQLILERLGFTQSTSYDLTKDGRLKICVSIPKTDPDSTVRREVLTTVARTSKEARILLSRKTNLILVSGQLRTTIYGSALAKSGLWKHLDTLQRDPSISPRVKIVIVEGEAHKLLERNFPEHPRTGQYIDRMLEKASRGEAIPRVTLYDFARDYYDDGIDPIAPLIVEREKNAEIGGIALFDEDKYKMKIHTDQILLFSLAHNDLDKGELSIDLGGAHGTQSIMLDSIESKRKLKIRRSGASSFDIDMTISVHGSIREYIGTLQLSETKDRKKLEKDMAEHLAKQIGDLVRSIQQHRVDSLGLGKAVRNSLSYKEWKSLDWKSVYPQIKTNVKINLKIKDQGKVK